MIVTMLLQNWVCRRLRIPKSDVYGKDSQGNDVLRKRVCWDFVPGGVYEVPDELGEELCHGALGRKKTGFSIQAGMAYYQQQFVEGNVPQQKAQSAVQMAEDLDALRERLDEMEQSMRHQGIATEVDQDELDAVRESVDAVGLVDDGYPIDEDDPSGRYTRVRGVIQDSQTGQFICPICKKTKTTEDVRNPQKSIEMHMRQAHGGE
jgi:hypothetical protein